MLDHMYIHVTDSPVTEPKSSKTVRTKMHGCIYSIPTQLSHGPGLLSRYSVSLPAGRSGDRILVGASFFAHFQTDPGAHPASYTISAESFAGVERTARNADHPLPSTTEIKERVDLYLYPLLGLHGLF
jgi:hypothetical protein